MDHILFFPNCPQNRIPSFFIVCLSIWSWLDVNIFHNGRKVGGSMQLEAVFLPFYSPPRKLQVYFLKTTNYTTWLYSTFFSVQNKIVTYMSFLTIQEIWLQMVTHGLQLQSQSWYCWQKWSHNGWWTDYVRKIPKGVYPMTNISRFCIKWASSSKRRL
jgi:hypothetical protein